MSAAYTDSIVRLRAPLIADKYGNTSLRDWANASRLAVGNVSVQPDASQEETGDRNSVATGWRLFTRRGVDLDLLSTDRVEFGGMTLEADGEIGRYRFSGRVHHVEARLKRVTG